MGPWFVVIRYQASLDGGEFDYFYKRFPSYGNAGRTLHREEQDLGIASYSARIGIPRDDQNMARLAYLYLDIHCPHFPIGEEAEITPLKQTSDPCTGEEECKQIAISFFSDPPGAKVHIEGRFVGQTPIEHTFCHTTTARGDVERRVRLIEFYKEGYTEQSINKSITGISFENVFLVKEK